MYPKDLQKISHVSVNRNLMTKNGTQKWKNGQKTENDKNGTMTVSA